MLFAFGLSGLMAVMDGNGQFFKGSYFKTQQFETELNQFINYAAAFEWDSLRAEEAKKAITVSEEEIDEHRFRYGDLNDQVSNINGQYEDRIADAVSAGNKEAAEIYRKERDSKIDDITKNFSNDEFVREKVVKEKEQKIDEFYRSMEAERPEYDRYQSAFKYYLVDTKTDTVHTNLNVKSKSAAEEFLNKEYMLFIRNYTENGKGFLELQDYYKNINETMEPISGDTMLLEGRIAVSESAPDSNPVMVSYQNFKQQQKIFFIFVAASLVALIASVLTFKRMKLAVQRHGGEMLPLVNLFPVDVRLAAVVTAGLMAFAALEFLNVSIIYSADNFILSLDDIAICLAASTFLTAFAGFLAIGIFSEVKSWREFRMLWEKSLSVKIWNGFKDFFLIRSIGFQMAVLMAVVSILGASAVLVLIEPNFIIVFGLCLLMGLTAMIMLVRSTGYFNTIIANTAEIAQGRLGPDLPVKGKSVLARHAADINSLKHGFKVSQNEQAKSERLKTELITNVSHDLRTPLTSIITYTELLKAEGISEQERSDYIEIIDRKSQRLKVLIDDLFEASKMASGSIELVKEKVDLVQLLQQALAEHDERIAQSSLTFRVASPENPVYAHVDGQKLWRVFDNLIGNILNYSLENTRVFISVSEQQGQAIMVFKNVSKYELSENSDELFERFKRGDQSRHTDGSGLGLAIAKSIADVHDGSLDIDVDGDLFKVTVKLRAIGIQAV